MELFEAVGEALRGMVAPELGTVRMRSHRYGIKVWFDTLEAPRLHYEAQVLGAKHVAEAKVLAIEVGFHAEARKVEENDAAVAAVMKAEKRWRKVLGPEPVAAPFLGRPEDWRRISETWADPDLGDEDIAMELAARLADYVTAFEPLLRR